MSSLDKAHNKMLSLGGTPCNVKTWGGQVVSGRIIKEGLLLKHVAYVNGSRWSYPDPYIYTVKIGRFPNWRVFPTPKGTV